MLINELLDLRARFLAAKVNKHAIGSASSYAEALEKECGPVVFQGAKHSAAHLLALVEKAIRLHGSPKAPKKSEPVTKVEVKIETKPTKKSDSAK